MEDLLRPQIQDSCKLALPDGLKELMSDISREVLRYQPRNLYQFIADYLSALLVTRDNLSVAGCICSDICECGCEPELQRELKDLGLPDVEVKIAKDVIVNYFEKGPVSECSLLLQLMKYTTIDEVMMPAVQQAIRTAYLRHQAHNTTVYESSSDSGQDEMLCAAKHTLDLYRKTAPCEETYKMMAQKIETSYRAYGVKRYCEPKDHVPKATHTKTAEKNVTLLVPKSSCQRLSYDITFPKTTYSEESMSETSWLEDADIAISSSMNKKRVNTMSSTSLAGSFMTLPSYVPYSAHECDVLSDLDEIPEREHAYIDYTIENPHISMVTEDKLVFRERRECSRNISFSDSVPDAVRKMGLDADNDSVPARYDDVDQNVSSMEAEPDMFYRSEDVMSVDNNNYDGDIEQSDENV